MPRIKFWKYHGTGNDFILFDGRDPACPPTAGLQEITPKLCHRRFGIGADGVIAIRPLEKHPERPCMDYINADGSTAEMCGNGIRCLVRWLEFIKWSGITDDIDEVDVMTRSGLKHCWMHRIEREEPASYITVDMGSPSMLPKDIPVKSKNDVLDKKISVDGYKKKVRINAVSMGNPHCVVISKNPERDVLELGPKLEVHKLFPQKTNVEFIKLIEKNHLLFRVWERGVGETFSCGTGACAAGVIAHTSNLASSPIIIETKGGDLKFEWSGNYADNILLSGPATFVARGEVDL